MHPRHQDQDVDMMQRMFATVDDDDLPAAASAGPNLRSPKASLSKKVLSAVQVFLWWHVYMLFIHTWVTSRRMSVKCPSVYTILFCSSYGTPSKDESAFHPNFHTRTTCNFSRG